MTFQVQIQNLGKLADATVRIGGLTVLAGVNNTGKTFFSKSLYSVIHAMNANHLMVEFDHRARPLRVDFHWMSEGMQFLASDPPSIVELISMVDRMELAAKECSIGDGKIIAFDQAYPALKESAEMLQATYNELEPALQNWSQRQKRKNSSEFEQMHKHINEGVSALCNLGNALAGNIATRGFGNQALQNFRQNFQIPNIAGLSNGRDAAIYFDGALIFGFGERGEGRQLKVDVGGIRDFPMFARPGMRRLPPLVFLESPALWRLKGILESVMLESRNGRVRTDVPDYFRALLAALPKEYSGEMPFPEVYRRLTEDVIGGKIVRNDLGELRFAESGGGSYALSMTATGVVNLGILALLIERKILDKGSFLFIDEPESNLHPAWQVEMVRALFDLARGGVNVVMATHSVDIVKYLEVHAKEHPEDKDLIALNHFTVGDGVKSGEFSDLLDDVLIELTEPFHKLRLREMRASRP